MAATYPIEPGLSWQDHYAKYGFAVVRDVMAPDWLDRARAEAARLAGNDLPPEQWTTQNVGKLHIANEAVASPVFRDAYRDPGFAQLMDQLIGPGMWDGQPAFQLFISPFNPDAKAELCPWGHLDFPHSPIPILGSGAMAQIALYKSEPFSGNITVWPGSHIAVQRRLFDNPEVRYPQDFEDIAGQGEPYEFVANPGDVMFFSHLIFHQGNANHAANRSPRVCLHMQVNREAWLNEIDPDQPDLSAWERSLAQNGYYRLPFDDKHRVLSFKGQQAG